MKRVPSSQVAGDGGQMHIDPLYIGAPLDRAKVTEPMARYIFCNPRNRYLVMKVLLFCCIVVARVCHL